MRKVCKVVGELFLGIASRFSKAGVASCSYIGAEEMPKSMKNQR